MLVRLLTLVHLPTLVQLVDVDVLFYFGLKLRLVWLKPLHCMNRNDQKNSGGTLRQKEKKKKKEKEEESNSNSNSNSNYCYDEDAKVWELIMLKMTMRMMTWMCLKKYVGIINEDDEDDDVEVSPIPLPFGPVS